MGVWFRGLLICSAWLLCARLASAQRVLVAEPPRDDAVLFEAFGRLRAELALEKFEVVLLERGAHAVDFETLQTEAQRRGAFAAVALQRRASGTTADICIVDRVTGKTTIRRLLIDDSKVGPTLLAIRAVDLLRASLLELPPGERPPQDVVGVEKTPPPPEVLDFARRAPQFQLRAGAAALLNPSLGASVGVALALAYRPTAHLSLGVQVGGPLFGGEFQAETGSARVRQEFALLQAVYHFSNASSGRRWEWGPLIGVGAAHLEASGNVEPPLVSRSADAFAACLEAGGSVEYYFSSAVSLHLQLAGLGFAPQPVVAVHDEQSSRVWLQGLATLSVGVSF